MIEKVNPKHPDKIADRIAGAILDLSYKKQENPRVAVEVLIGHGSLMIINETSVSLSIQDIRQIVYRIVQTKTKIKYIEVPQNSLLSKNQEDKLKAGDNGIFKGVPIDDEVKELSQVAKKIYNQFSSDGKYVLDKINDRLIICQSKAYKVDLVNMYESKYKNLIVNPIGYWSGGIDVDAGATNRKLGSDMGHAVTGGGLHGKDLSKADVSVNIYAHLKAQETQKEVNICCAIGDETIDGKTYQEIIEIARKYINDVGGFEKFAEWGLT